MTELPSGWVEATLGQVATKIGSGATPTGGERSYKLSGVPLIRSLNVHFDGVRAEGLAFLDEKQAGKLDNVIVEADDVLLNITGASIGRVAVAPNAYAGARVNQHVSIIRLVQDVLPQYVRSFLASTAAQDFITRENYGVTRQALTKSMIEEFAFPLPPMAEQKRIVAKLDALNAKSARARTELARIETLVSRYTQAVLSKAFSGELTREWREINGVALSAAEKVAVEEELLRALSSRRGARTNTHQVDFNAVAAIPSSWAHAVIGVGADMTVGFAFKSEWFRADGVKLLRGANIAPRAIDWSDLKCLDASRAQEFARYLIEENDIVLAMDRPVISTGLKVARVAKQDAGGLLVQRVTRFRASEFVAQDFLWWFLNTQMFLAHSLHRATGSDLPHISGDDIATCPLPVPPLEEQHEIVRRIGSAFAKIDRLAKEAKRALELVSRLDEAILTKAFRGELVPQGEGGEPAEHLLARIRAERQAAPKAKRRRHSQAALG